MSLGNRTRKIIHDMGTKVNSISLGTRLLKDLESKNMTDEGKEILNEIIERVEGFQTEYESLNKTIRSLGFGRCE